MEDKRKALLYRLNRALLFAFTCNLQYLFMNSADFIVSISIMKHPMQCKVPRCIFTDCLAQMLIC